MMEKSEMKIALLSMLSQPGEVKECLQELKQPSPEPLAEGAVGDVGSYTCEELHDLIQAMQEVYDQNCGIIV